MKLCFGDIVVVEENLIGVVVKTWIGTKGVHHEVYVRDFNSIKEYLDDEVERYMVRHKELDDQEIEWQHKGIFGHTV